jgi:hypothetical protein
VTRPQLESRIEQAASSPRPWLLLLAAFLLLTHLQWWWNGSGDQMNYLSIARHFAQGEIARFDQPDLRYAPGYPLLIAPTFWLSDKPFLLINLIHTGLLIAMLGPMTRWFARYAGGAAPLLTALVATNLSLWFYTTRPLSEAAFIPCLLVTGVLLQQITDQPRLRNALPWILAGAAATLVLVMIRQLGVFLLSALAVVLLIRTLRGQTRWWDALTRLATTALPACLSIVALSRYEQNAADASEMTYVDHLLREDITPLERLALCTHLRISEIGRLMMPGMRTTYAQEGDWLDINMVIYTALFLLLAWGWIRLIRRRADVLLWFLPFYLGFLLFWPYEAATRYATPILPMLVLVLWGAIEPLTRSRLRILAAAAALHLLVTLGYWGIELTNMNTADEWASAQAVAAQVADDRDHVAVRGVTTSWQYRLRFLLNRNIQFANNPDQLAEHQPHWLIVGPDKPAPSDWTPVLTLDTLTLYRHPEPTPAQPHPVQ